MLEEHFPQSAGFAVLHWFSGSLSEVKRASEFGCWFSVNEKMGQSENGRRLIEAMPIDRILTETDGPFTEIEPGVSTCPWDVGRAVKVVAEIKGMTETEVNALVWKNLFALESSF
jgi:TatD DNase family protein